VLSVPVGDVVATFAYALVNRDPGAFSTLSRGMAGMLYII
jgi:hypothetical protein